MPCFMEKMDEFNLKDPMNAMYNNDDVYSLHSEDIINFLTLHYGDFDVENICKLGDLEIVQYRNILE